MATSSHDKLNLTGMWQGLYTYAESLEPNPFVAILIHSGSGLTGTTHEPCMIGAERGKVLYAALDGTCIGTAVAFINASDPSSGWTHWVRYDGRLSGDGTRIESHWIVPGIWSGKFLMERPGPKDKATKVKKREPIGAL